MIFALATLLVKITGFDFNKALKVARIIFFGGIVLVVFIAGVFIFRACNKPVVPEIDEEKLQKINSQNEKEKREALNNYFEEIDAQREISDVERKEIIGRVENETKFGKNVSAADLERLVSEENK